MAGPRWERLLLEGAVPAQFRLLLDGPPPLAVGRHDDGGRRRWDVYLHDGHDGLAWPVFRFRGREVTGT